MHEKQVALAVPSYHFQACSLTTNSKFSSLWLQLPHSLMLHASMSTFVWILIVPALGIIQVVTSKSLEVLTVVLSATYPACWSQYLTPFK